jgi:hypothetical protein
MWSVRALRILVAVAVIAGMTLPASAQRFGGGRNRVPGFQVQPYDGSFTLVRLYYGNYPGWSYDFPEMESNLTGLLPLITGLKPNKRGTNIMRMDDPDLMQFPVAYLSEPGYWYPTDSEALGLRTYIEKGGFLIVDDFHFDNEWAVFEAAMRRVLPNARIERLTSAHPIFHTFFEIDNLRVPYPGGLGQQGLYGEFFGIHQDNDRDKPLNVVIDYNMDIGDYMEWSGSGFYLVDPSNEAFKFMINYLIYGHTR